jgi:hypothetical protein
MTMARVADGTLQRIAKNTDEVDIETRLDAKSPVHRTTIWIVPTDDGVFVRSFNGKRARWYREALANRKVTIRAGRRKVTARVEPASTTRLIREASDGYRDKYGGRWPDDTKPMLRRSVLPTTLRLREITSGK